MAHNQTVTIIRRLNYYTTSDFALRNQMVEEFATPDGSRRLASVLGVSKRTAERILEGKAHPNMSRLAYHYSFRPTNEESGWRILQMDEEPFDAGPPLEWDDRLVEFLRQVLGHPCNSPDLQVLAWRMDTTLRRLRDGMRRHGI